MRTEREPMPGCTSEHGVNGEAGQIYALYFELASAGGPDNFVTARQGVEKARLVTSERITRMAKAR